MFWWDYRDIWINHGWDRFLPAALRSRFRASGFYAVGSRISRPADLFRSMGQFWNLLSFVGPLVWSGLTLEIRSCSYIHGKHIRNSFCARMHCEGEGLAMTELGVSLQMANHGSLAVRSLLLYGSFPVRKSLNMMCPFCGYSPESLISTLDWYPPGCRSFSQGIIFSIPEYGSTLSAQNL